MCNLDEITVAHRFSGPHADNGAFGLAGAEEAFVLLLIAFRADEQVLQTVFEWSEPVIISQATARYDTDTSKWGSSTGIAFGTECHIIDLDSGSGLHVGSTATDRTFSSCTKPCINMNSLLT